MFTASRRLTLYWVLLLQPTLAVGVGAILLLRREQARLAERTAVAEVARLAAVVARARLIVENIELLVGDAENGLLDRLAAEPDAGIDRFLAEWEKSNSLVRVGFRATQLGRIVRPDANTVDAEAAGFIRRFSRVFTENPPWLPEVDAANRRELEKQDLDNATERKSVASNVYQQQSARRDVYDFAFSTNNSGPGTPASAGAKEAVADERTRSKDVSGDRRGWFPLRIDGRLHLLAWVQPLGSNEIRGVEVDVAELVRILGGALPVEIGADTGFEINDDQGRVLHQVGKVVPTPLPDEVIDSTHVPIAATALPGWSVAAYLRSGAPDRSAGFFAVSSVLVAIFVGVIAFAGFTLLSQAQRSDAEAALKTSFVANVSHEFKTPLTTIRLYSELLEQGRVRDAAQSQDYLRTIGRETQRLARLVGNVLDFSRLEQGKKQYDLQSIDLVPELARLLETQAPRLAEAGMELKTDLPQTARLATDREAVQQVILNLLDNATKYAASGREVLVSLTIGSSGGAVVKVADRGPGVPENQRERIFEKFHRVDQSLTADRSGAGLGLSIARQLARGLGGDLRCEPRQGGGAAFVLELP